MFIIDDSTKGMKFEPPKGQFKGLILPEGFASAYAGVADPVPNELLIPRSEWQARIEEQKQRKSSLKDLITQAGLPAKDQGQTNYCWVVSPTHCLEIMRVLQNQAMIELSGTSVGARVKNFRNVGGFGAEALEGLSKWGACPSSLWPNNVIDKRLLTEANKAEALKYRVTEWWNAQPRNTDLLISLLLRNIPVSLGFNWWGHQVTGVRAVWQDGQAWPEIRNQWANWGEDNYAVLKGSKAIPDDMVCPRVGTAA